jgi:hypothetical protein
MLASVVLNKFIRIVPKNLVFSIEAKDVYPSNISYHQTPTGCIDAKLPNTTYGIEKNNCLGFIKPCSKTKNYT